MGLKLAEIFCLHESMYTGWWSVTFDTPLLGNGWLFDVEANSAQQAFDYLTDLSMDPNGSGAPQSHVSMVSRGIYRFSGAEPATVYDLSDLDAQKKLAQMIAKEFEVVHGKDDELEYVEQHTVEGYNEAPKSFRVWYEWEYLKEHEHLIGVDSPENER